MSTCFTPELTRGSIKYRWRSSTRACIIWAFHNFKIVMWERLFYILINKDGLEIQMYDTIRYASNFLILPSIIKIMFVNIFSSQKDFNKLSRFWLSKRKWDLTKESHFGYKYMFFPAPAVEGIHFERSRTHCSCQPQLLNHTSPKYRW